jgi:hypothetical protein
MRPAVPAVLVVLSLAAGAFAVAQAPVPAASPALAGAREALGGEQKLAAIRTFTATGRTRKVSGSNLVPIEFEIACELPDKYVRRDEIPAQESGPTSTGFNGDALIQLPPPPEAPPQTGKPPASAATPTTQTFKPLAAGANPPPSPGKPPATADTPPPAATPPAAATTAIPPPPPGTPPGAPPAGASAQPVRPAGMSMSGPPPDPRKARVTSVKQDFVRLTLGMFATSFASYPLTFTPAGQAEAPQGKADVLDVKGAGNFAIKFFINSETHLPIMISWTTPATSAVVTAPGQSAPDSLPPGTIIVPGPALPGPTATDEERAKYAKDVQDLRRKALAGKTVEYRIYYADYRDVGNGIKFPFRTRRAIGGETVEETNFDAFKINARVDARRFEPVK